MDITILEKTPSAVRAGDLEKTPLKVQSNQKWVINTSFINDREKHDVFEKITDFIEYSNRVVEMEVKVVTLTNI